MFYYTAVLYFYWESVKAKIQNNYHNSVMFPFSLPFKLNFDKFSC